MLKLGKETGSLVNHLYSRSKPVEPEVGMPCTVLHWTDRSAMEILAVRRNKAGEAVGITVRPLRAIRTDQNGMSDAQDYRYEPMPEARTAEVRRNRKGEFTFRGALLVIGVADTFHDYSF